MTANAMPDASFSTMTMALFKDSGWYDVDYTKAETLAFGLN